jgi:hypothetical protein
MIRVHTRTAPSSVELRGRPGGKFRLRRVAQAAKRPGIVSNVKFPSCFFRRTPAQSSGIQSSYSLTPPRLDSRLRVPFRGISRWTVQRFAETERGGVAGDGGTVDPPAKSIAAAGITRASLAHAPTNSLRRRAGFLAPSRIFHAGFPRQKQRFRDVAGTRSHPGRGHACRRGAEASTKTGTARHSPTGTSAGKLFRMLGF